MSTPVCCPACNSARTETIYHLPAIPVQSCILLDSAAEADAFPVNEMKLTLCRDCGFLFNAAFDLSLVDYASPTEESQHYSATFNQFSTELIQEIGREVEMPGRLTVEIGCGKGDFLEALVRETGTHGLGIDPGFIPERGPDTSKLPLSFRKEYFERSQIDQPPDIILCRHTLEHIPNVHQFMSDVVTFSGERPEVDVVFETPCAKRVLSEGAFWDIYHEHCSYFTIGSHARLFRRVGLDVTKSYLAYGDQYIIQYARPGEGEPRPEELDFEEVLALADAFPAVVAEVQAKWSDTIESAADKGQNVAIWGGGSKCVAFLTTLGLADKISHVVDINPHKQGKYVPGTALQVVAPEGLQADPPALVIVMNPIYVKEISANLEALGISADVVAV